MRIDEDGDAKEAVAPVGAPLRWYEAVLPAALLAAAAVAAAISVVPRVSPGYAVYLLVASLVVLAAAVALGVCGWRAYATLDAVWVRRYRLAGDVALAALGLLLLLAPFSAFVFACAGYRAAALDLPLVTRITLRASPATWHRRAIWCGVSAVVVTVAKPLLLGLGSPLLAVPALLAAVCLALAAGFAYRLGRVEP